MAILYIYNDYQYAQSSEANTRLNDQYVIKLKGSLHRLAIKKTVVSKTLKLKTHTINKIENKHYKLYNDNAEKLRTDKDKGKHSVYIHKVNKTRETSKGEVDNKGGKPDKDNKLSALQ